MAFIRKLGFAACLCSLWGCSKAPETIVSTVLADEVDRLRRQYVQALETNNVESLLQLYAQDVVLIGYGADSQAVLADRDRRETYRPGMEKHFAEYDHAGFRMSSHEVKVFGKIAIDWGDYEEVHTRFDDGKRSSTSGSYMHLLRLREDGAWEIIRVLWS